MNSQPFLGHRNRNVFEANRQVWSKILHALFVQIWLGVVLTFFQECSWIGGLVKPYNVLTTNLNRKLWELLKTHWHPRIAHVFPSFGLLYHCLFFVSKALLAHLKRQPVHAPLDHLHLAEMAPLGQTALRRTGQPNDPLAKRMLSQDAGESPKIPLVLFQEPALIHQCWERCSGKLLQNRTGKASNQMV